MANGNGVAGQDAGIIMAGAGVGTGVHDNTISNNQASGDGLAGIAIHDHFPGNFNNNVITNNHLSNNNLDGDFEGWTLETMTFKATSASQVLSFLSVARDG